MNTANNVGRSLGWLLVCALLLGGCLKPTTNNILYALQPVRQPPLGHDFTTSKELILLMPIQLAPHLQGRGLLTQRTSGEARASANHLWAGPLDQQISQQMVADLKDLLATDQVAAYPGPRYGVIHYQLEVDINEFSGNGRQFITTAVYTLSDSVRKTIVARKTFRQTRPIDKPEYSGYVDSGSQAVADLSREVAAALLSAHRSQPVPPIRP